MARSPRSRGISAGVLAAVMALGSGCQGPRSMSGTPGAPGSAVMPPVAAFAREPMIRVRIAADEARIEFEADAPLLLGPGPGQETLSRPRQFHGPIAISRTGGQFLIAPQRGAAVRWALPTLAVRPSRATMSLRVGARTFSHRIVCVGPRTASPADGDRFDVVNHLPLESYLAGVLQSELYHSWHPTTFRAQAVAARSYALYQLARHQDRWFDVESTTADQAYGGASTLPKARTAARDTRGLVLTWKQRVLPGYYSSCSGGTGQDASVALVDAPDVKPLRGRAQGAWGAASRFYRWGPIARDKGTLGRRIAAWGRASAHPSAGLGRIEEVRISATNQVGRPSGFTIRDSGGQTFSFGPEQFRFACNFEGEDAAPVPDALQLRSSHVRVLVGPKRVHFDGRGFGHGVGLDQFGAEAMAQQGFNEQAILGFYYPRAQIHRAYGSAGAGAESTLHIARAP